MQRKRASKVNISSLLHYSISPIWSCEGCVWTRTVLSLKDDSNTLICKGLPESLTRLQYKNSESILDFKEKTTQPSISWHTYIAVFWAINTEKCSCLLISGRLKCEVNALWIINTLIRIPKPWSALKTQALHIFSQSPCSHSTLMCVCMCYMNQTIYGVFSKLLNTMSHKPCFSVWTLSELNGSYFQINMQRLWFCFYFH